MNHQIVHLNLRVSDNYTPPPGFPQLTTRRGTNKLNEAVYSRLDYILTNSDCTIDTEFVENISDHIFFNLHLDLKHAGVTRALSYDRKQINREISTFVNEDITSILTYIKTNIHCFRRLKAPKPPTLDHVPFRVAHDQERLLSDWMNDYLIFAKSVADLRFSAFQGLAFKTLQIITKYDQFHKRDGSVIKSLKDQHGDIITDPSLVSKAL